MTSCFLANIRHGRSAFAKVEDWFEPTLKKAKLEEFTFHDLRHSYGSLLLDAGAPLSYVSEQMGHASIMVTASTYAHALKKNSGFVNRLDTELASQPAASGTRWGNPAARK